jgi:hypothetical protein
MNLRNHTFPKMPQFGPELADFDAAQGGYKLKIPTLLLNEKEKTRSRFAQVIFARWKDLHSTYTPLLL